MPSTTSTLLSPAAYVMQMAAPRRSSFFRIFRHPRLRPPVVEEMQPDLEHLIAKTVRPYVCPDNVLLHEEDLASVCRAKLNDLVLKGTLEKCPTRAKFFGMAKTSFKNAVYSLVQREVFTVKRTGLKAPPRNISGVVEDFQPSHSVRKVSLDDPDSVVQVGDTACEMPFTSEVLDDIKILLLPVERMVVDQVVSPNLEACQLAWLDSQRGGSSTKVNVTYAHQAAGLGLDVKVYRKILDGIKPKLTKFMHDEKSGESPDQLRIRLAESTLRNLFGLQIPPNTDAVVKKRIFTMSARDQLEKVGEDVAGLLEVVGAYTPVMLGSRLSCFGVMWQRNHKVCATCLLQEQCSVLTMNLGLGEMGLSKEALGKNFVKIPVVGPRDPAVGVPASEVFTKNDVEEELLNYLGAEFRRSQRQDGLWFFHGSDGGQSAYLMQACKADGIFRLMFQAPSEALRAKLTHDNRSWYLPEGISLEDAKDLIDAHTNEVMGMRK